MIAGCSEGDPCPLDGERSCSTLCYHHPDDSGTVLRCASDCATNEDCDTTESCATLEGGLRACLPRCVVDGRRYGGDTVCVDGAERHCSTLSISEVSCRQCCLTGESCEYLCEEGEVCRVDGSCTPPDDVGAPCLSHGECSSGNCSAVRGSVSFEEGVCLVGHGEPCTGDNCSRCVQLETTTYCHRQCTRETRTGECVRCVGSTDDDTFWCHFEPEGPRVDELTCPFGYRPVNIGGTFPNTCVPNDDAFVCGSASVGPPCE